MTNKETIAELERQLCAARLTIADLVAKLDAHRRLKLAMNSEEEIIAELERQLRVAQGTIANLSAELAANE